MSRPASPTTALVARFRRQRPLRGGSLLVTLFGDAIAPRGGAVALSSLIRLAAPFGLNERLVRTAMTRLADDGWFTIRRVGRLSEYRLTREGQERFTVATRHVYGNPNPPWFGRWTLLLMPPVSASLRLRARESLEWAGFGEPLPGLFAHPAPGALNSLIAQTPVLRKAIVLTTTKGPVDSHRRVAELAWNLDELAKRYRRFISHFEPVCDALATAEPVPLASFVIRTLLIHEYRKIHLRDPLLPAALLPHPWVGAEAHALCRTLYKRVAPAADRHLSKLGATINASLPEAGNEFTERFAETR